MVSSPARVSFGSLPRNASLAPSSPITASVPSGTDQSSRPSPPEAVSPETPAFAIVTLSPLAFSAFSSFAGSASGAERPSPALSESPKTTIRTGPSAAAALNAAAILAKHASAMIASQRWTGRPGFPYDRGRTWNGRKKDRMNDTSIALPAAIRLSGVNLSLGRDAARVHILKDIDLHIGTGEAVGLIGPAGSGKPTLLMGGAGRGGRRNAQRPVAAAGRW